MDKPPSKVIQRLSSRLSLLDVPPVSPDAAAHEEPERAPPAEKRKAEVEPIPDEPANKKNLCWKRLKQLKAQWRRGLW